MWVTRARPGYFHDTVEQMLPQIADKLEPFWADFSTSGGSGFGDYLAKRGEEVAEALVSVTDAMAAASKRPVIIKAYRTVRGRAARHVEAALPRVGDLGAEVRGLVTSREDHVESLRLAVAGDPSSPHLSADRITATVYVVGAKDDDSFTAEQAERFPVIWGYARSRRRVALLRCASAS